MKRAILILIIGILFSGLAIAADLELSGKTFQATINEADYTLIFKKESSPFGGGEQGTATLIDPTDAKYKLSYQFSDPVCVIDGLRFIYLSGQLIYVAPDTIAFSEVKE